VTSHVHIFIFHDDFEMFAISGTVRRFLEKFSDDIDLVVFVVTDNDRVLFFFYIFILIIALLLVLSLPMCLFGVINYVEWLSLFCIDWCLNISALQFSYAYSVHLFDFIYLCTVKCD